MPQTTTGPPNGKHMLGVMRRMMMMMLVVIGPSRVGCCFVFWTIYEGWFLRCGRFVEGFSSCQHNDGKWSLILFGALYAKQL